MKKIIIIILMLVSSSIYATTYYVSSAGSNLANGTSTTTSWQTLSKVVGTTFVLGDTVKLKCGDLWTETFNLTSGNVVVTSYGIGNKPEIRGWGSFAAAKISGNWSEYISGVWRMNSSNFGTRLWLNGKEVKESKTTTLTSEYCWRFDGTYFYLKSPSNPASYFSTILISTGNQFDLVTISDKSNVTFDNINFSGGRFCLRLSNAKNWVIKNCEIGYRTTEYGVIFSSLGGDSCVNISIHDNLVGCGDSLTYNYYRKNGTIRPSDMTTGDAVSFNGKASNCNVYSNYIYGWSHCGIYFHDSSTFLTHDNHAYNNFITAPFISYARGMGIDLKSGIRNSYHHNTIYQTSVRNQLNSGGGFKFYNNIIDTQTGTQFPEKSKVGQGISIEGYASNAINMEIYNNIITNCANEGIFITWYNSTYQKSYNNIHDNNFIENGGITGYQIWIDNNNVSINNNTYYNNHLFSSATNKVIYTRTGTKTVSEFNLSQPSDGDVVSGIDGIITFDIPTYGTKTTPLSEMIIEHNSTGDTLVVNLDYPMLSTLGDRYELTASIDPYSSMILLKDVSPAYYVSSSGNDSNDGLTEETAWKTLAKVNATTFIAGDKILFRRGDTFYGSLVLNNYLLSAPYITFGAYGTGANPIITGFTTVTAWTNLGGNIWESTNAVSTLETCNMVSINGVNIAMGRYPNTGYLTYQSHSGTISITSSSLTGTPDWVGSEAVIRTSRFTIDRALITSHATTTIGFSSIGNEPTDGYGFFIQNSPNVLDAQNEWYYNPTTKKIRVFSANQPTDVKISSVNDLFTISANYTVVDGLDFTGANNVAIANYEAYGRWAFIIQNCNISFSGVNGIYARYDDVLVENCTVLNSNNNGIDFSKSDSKIKITNTIVQNSGLFAGMGIGGYSGIVSSNENTHNITVEYCKILNSGFNGVTFSGDSTLIKNNYIDSFCSVLDDGGGIYTYRSTGLSERKQLRVYGNVVLNGIGASNGTSSMDLYASGIYADNLTTNFEIANNSIANCKWAGIFIHDSRDFNIHNNTCYNNANSQFFTQYDSGYIPTGGVPPNSILSNNLFVSKTANQRVLAHDNFNGIYTNLATQDNNYLARPIDDNKIIGTYNGTSYELLTLDEWKLFSGKDANSKKSPKTISSLNDMDFIYNETGIAKSFELPFVGMDITGKRYIGETVTIQPYTSLVLIKDVILKSFGQGKKQWRF